MEADGVGEGGQALLAGGYFEHALCCLFESELLFYHGFLEYGRAERSGFSQDFGKRATSGGRLQRLSFLSCWYRCVVIGAHVKAFELKSLRSTRVAGPVQVFQQENVVQVI